MKILIGGVKRAFSSGPSSQGSGSRSGDESQDSTRSSSFVPSPHETGGSIRYLAHDDVPMATDGDDIFIHSTEEMEKYESLHNQEFGYTRVYDVNLLERVGMDKELPLILWTIGWGKLYGGDRKRRMDDFATIQTEMQVSIDSQTSMMHDIFSHFRINPDA
jgi:hypothetical protein